MNVTDTKMESAIGESVSAFSEEFAQSRERVHHGTPAREAALREGYQLQARVEFLQAKLKRFEELGESDAEQIKRVEAELDRAVVAFVEWSTAGDEEVTPGEDLEGYVSLSDLMRLDLDSGKELSTREEEERVATLSALMRFSFQDGISDIGLAFRNWLAVVNRVCPEMLGGISKADLAVLLGETRAATSAREIRIVEKYLKQSGTGGFKLLGGTKSEETRARSAKAAAGNTSRRDGSWKFAR